MKQQAQLLSGLGSLVRALGLEQQLLRLMDLTAQAHLLGNETRVFQDSVGHAP